MVRANYIHLDHLLRSVLAAPVLGDLAEFGVWHGTTFMPMCELASQHGRTIHAVDSFEGMDAETKRDAGQYRKGELSVGGSAVFRMLTKPYGKTVQIHEGFVPSVLSELDSCRFAFVHLDLDQYAPTRSALAFLWPRMNPGGVLICHDWFRDRDILAAGAMADWMQSTGLTLAGESPNTGHGWFVKAAA